MPQSKLSQLRAAADVGDWATAIRIAARFPRLGDARGPVLDAHMALTNRRFVLQLRRDPDALIAAGVAALRAAYEIPAPPPADQPAAPPSAPGVAA